MNLRTFERLLHQKSEWHETIAEARSHSGYDPSWSWEERRQWDDRECPFNNQHTNFMALTFLAEEALASIGFTGQKALGLYWLACFYNDYESSGLDAVELWPSHWEAPRRVFPYIEWKITYDSEVDTFHMDIHRLLLTKEFTRELLDWKSELTGEEKGKVSHDVHRAKVGEGAFMKESEVEDQIRRAAIGEITYTQAIQEEYERELESERHLIESSPSKFAKRQKLRHLRRRVRERVRNRFKRAGLPIDYKHCNWWSDFEKKFLEK